MLSVVTRVWFGEIFTKSLCRYLRYVGMLGGNIPRNVFRDSMKKDEWFLEKAAVIEVARLARI